MSTHLFRGIHHRDTVGRVGVSGRRGRASADAPATTMEDPSNRRSGPTTLHRLVLGILVASGVGLLGVACALAPRPDSLIYDGPRGRVSVETVPDSSFEATHPIPVEPSVVTLVLRGVTIQPQERILQTLLAGRTSPAPVFSEEEAAFLTPFIVKALAVAGPRQRVRFGVSTTAPGTNPDVAAGTLYAQGRLLHLTLTHYTPSRQGQDSKPGRLLPDPTEQVTYLVSFTPEHARVHEQNLVATFKEPAHTTVIIDVRVLAHTVESERITPPERREATMGKDAPPSADEQLQAIEDLIVRQAKENEALKSEMSELRRMLADQEAELNKLKKGKGKKDQQKKQP